jgi:sigma-E factor negative regulatory protein RseA
LNQWVIGMSDNKTEQLSALMDGEVDASECDLLIKRLCHNEASDEQACWERYHLIGDALKKNLPNIVKHDLSSRVSAALANEPTVLAPRRFKIHWKRVTKPLAGAAIAASVASVSIVGLRLILPEQAAVTTVATSSKDSLPLPQDGVTTVADSEDNAALKADERESRLNAYLVNHSEFAMPAGIQALPPYMRVVGYGQAEQE